MQLQAREKNLIIAGILLLSLTLSVTHLVLPGFDKIDTLKTKVTAKRNIRVEVMQLSAQLDQASNSLPGKKTDNKTSVNSLLPWLESQIAAFGLSEQLDQISPLFGADADEYREKASIRMNQVNLVQVLQFIDGIEAVSELRVIRADLRRLKEPGMLSLLIEVGLL